MTTPEDMITGRQPYYDGGPEFSAWGIGIMLAYIKELNTLLTADSLSTWTATDFILTVRGLAAAYDSYISSPATASGIREALNAAGAELTVWQIGFIITVVIESNDLRTFHSDSTISYVDMTDAVRTAGEDLETAMSKTEEEVSAMRVPIFEEGPEASLWELGLMVAFLDDINYLRSTHHSLSAVSYDDFWSNVQTAAADFDDVP